MKKLSYFMVFIIAIGFIIFGCEKLRDPVGVTSSEQSGLMSMVETNGSEVTLYAGQDIEVGTVSVWNDEETLYVRYNLTDNWYLTETHLHVATSPEGIPQTKKGNPIPGHFDYSMEHDPSVTEYLYTIPLEWDPDTELSIAAHAVVCYDDGGDPICETAWGEGYDFTGRNWATYFTYIVQPSFAVSTVHDNSTIDLTTLSIVLDSGVSITPLREGYASYTMVFDGFNYSYSPSASTGELDGFSSATSTTLIGTIDGDAITDFSIGYRMRTQAFRDFEFVVSGSGSVTFSADCSYSSAISTADIGITNNTEAYFNLQSNRMNVDRHELGTGTQSVSNGGAGNWQSQGTLSVSYFFNDGDIGYFWAQIANDLTIHN